MQGLLATYNINGRKILQLTSLLTKFETCYCPISRENNLIFEEILSHWERKFVEGLESYVQNSGETLYPYCSMCQKIKYVIKK